MRTMGKLSSLKPLILLILFNYLVIVFGSQAFYIIQISIERVLRPFTHRLLIGLIQTVIGLSLILLWVFVWLKLYKHLFMREISKSK